MKSLRLFLLLFTLTVLVTAGCKSKSGGGEKYDLSFSILKGPAFNQQTVMDINMITETMGMKMNIKMGMTMNLDFKILKETDSAREIEMTYKDVSMTMDMGSLNNADGAENASNSLQEKLNESMSRLKGARLTLVIDKSGKIKDVLGIDSFRHKIMQSGENTDPASMAQLEKMYDKDQLQNNLGQLFGFFSDGPVAVGESWNRDMSMMINNLKMNVKNKFTLLHVKEGVAEIKMESDLGGKGKVEQGTMTVDADMTGGQKGTLKVRLADGRLIDSKSEMDMKADMKVMDMKVPMTIKAVNSIKGS